MWAGKPASIFEARWAIIGTQRLPHPAHPSLDMVMRMLRRTRSTTFDCATYQQLRMRELAAYTRYSGAHQQHDDDRTRIQARMNAVDVSWRAAAINRSGREVVMLRHLDYRQWSRCLGSTVFCASALVISLLNPALTGWSIHDIQFQMREHRPWGSPLIVRTRP